MFRVWQLRYLLEGDRPTIGRSGLLLLETGFDFLSLHWIEGTDLEANQRWVARNPVSFIVFKFNCILRTRLVFADRTNDKPNRETPFLSTVENLWAPQIMSERNHAFQRTGSNNKLPSSTFHISCVTNYSQILRTLIDDQFERPTYFADSFLISSGGVRIFC